MKEALTTLGMLLACTVTAMAQVVEFDGDDAPRWARLLMIDEEAAIPRLVAGGVDALPVLQAVLADERKGVQEGVALVCERIGAPALPMGPALLAQLRDSEIHTTRAQAARALAAISDRRPEVVEALLEAAFAADPYPAGVPATLRTDLNGPFLDALQRLHDNAAQRVLRAIDGGSARSVAHAALVLDGLDDRAVPALIAALDAPTTAANADTHQAAHDSLLHRGWRVFTRLLRAGRVDLAHEALRVGAFRRIAWIEHYLVEPAAGVSDEPLPRLPAIRWQAARSRGDSLTLFRAEEHPHGYTIARLQLTIGPRGATGPVVLATTTTVPRALAGDAMRAVSMILATKVTLALRTGSGVTTDQPFVAMRIADGETELLAENFVARPTTENLPQRFQLEAIRDVLDDLLRDAVWQPRALADADREQLRETLARADSPTWLTARLYPLADALGVEHR